MCAAKPLMTTAASPPSTLFSVYIKITHLLRGDLAELHAVLREEVRVVDGVAIALAVRNLHNRHHQVFPGHHIAVVECGRLHLEKLGANFRLLRPLLCMFGWVRTIGMDKNLLGAFHGRTPRCAHPFSLQ